MPPRSPPHSLPLPKHPLTPHLRSLTVHSLCCCRSCVIVHKDVAPISIRNELSVVKHIARVCRACLREFDTTVEEDERLLRADGASALTMNERNAILMRKGEKEVGLYYIELEQEMDKLVALPWKDFKV